MVTVANIREIGAKDYDEVWAVVRSMKRPVPGVTKQVKELSPSWDLFCTYRKLVMDGAWDERTFQQVYAPKFLQEMKSKEALDELVEKSNEGKEMCIACFCQKRALCHTSIWAGILEWGTPVSIEGGDYGHYGVEGGFAHRWDRYFL